MGSLKMTRLEIKTNPVKMIVRSFRCSVNCSYGFKIKTKAIATANRNKRKYHKEQMRTLFHAGYLIPIVN